MNYHLIVGCGLFARSSRRFLSSCLGALALAVAVPSIAHADIVYDESISGDFSNSGLTPTLVTLHPGSNQILGTTGRGTVLDRDYFTVTVPSGFTLTSLIELPGTSSGGPVAFLGLQAGAQFTVPPTTPSAAGLLGWSHYGSVILGTNLLPLLAVPVAGSSGFTTPLGEGDYSFWIQELNPGTYPYGFDLGVAQAVPEPSTYGMIGGALVLALAIRRRLSKGSRTAAS